jgi:hypothetical protein
MAQGTAPSQWSLHLHAYREFDTAYLHACSNANGWGAVLHETPKYQARGFWYDTDRARHITQKELRAVRTRSIPFYPSLELPKHPSLDRF